MTKHRESYAEGVPFLSLGLRACERTLGHKASHAGYAKGVIQTVH